MNQIKNFEDLECWQSARVLVKTTYQICNQDSIQNDWETKNQLKRAALSIMNNLAEGFGRFGDKDSLRFYDIAKASAYEFKSMLYVLEDVGYFSPEQLVQIRQETNKTLNLTIGWIRYLSKRKEPHKP
ncbi:MAG: four helix bundle protein [Saprospiraceae bacterium]|nr:four helix bundle protein [Saprospiraceae bacterium]